MRKRHAMFTAAAGILTSAATATAGTFTPVTQVRSVTATATTVTTTGGPATTDTESDAAPAVSPFQSTRTAAVLVTPPSGAPPQYPQAYNYSASSTASQTSAATATALTGAGSSHTSAYQNGNSGQSMSSATSAYSVQFTVDVPTPVTLAGDLTGLAYYHPGPLESVVDTVTLSGSSAGTLYALTRHNMVDPFRLTVDSFDLPLGYAGVLVPGQTYTLAASTYTDATRTGVGETLPGDGQGGFYVALTAVPEPAAAVVVAVAGAIVIAGRRQRRRC